MKRLLPIVLLLSSLALGQGSSNYVSQVQDINGSGIPLASIRACTTAGTGDPCTPTVPIYSDAALTTPISNSTVIAEPDGNFTFYCKPGLMLLQVSASGMDSFTYVAPCPFIAPTNVFEVGTSAYPATDAGIHAAAAAAVAAGGGTVLVSYPTILTTALTLGADDSAKPPVQLLIGVGVTLTVSVTGGVDAIKVGDSCGIVGAGAPAPFSATLSGSRILVSATANVANVIAPLNKTGTQNGMYLSSFILQSTSGAAISSAGILIKGVFQNTHIRDVYTHDMYSSASMAALLITPASGGSGTGTSDIDLDNNNWDCTGRANCTPVSIQGIAASTVASIKFYGGGIQHAGSGLPLLNINGQTVSGGMNAIHFYAVHFETVAGGGASSIILTDARSVHFYGGSISGTAFTNVFSITQSGAGLTRDIAIESFYVSPAYTNFINNSINSFTLAGTLVSYVNYRYDTGDTNIQDVHSLAAGRFRASMGTALVAGDFAVSGGWGASASIANITGTDQAWQGTVTAAGAGQAASPTVTLTFHDAAWTGRSGTSVAPICATKIQANSESAAKLLTAITEVPTATTNVITYNDTPAVNKTYTFSSQCMGR